MTPEILLKPILGALIGYSTNWLAIKMLFKPHTEKRIGKIRIPFTPGLIPRERDRIAKSLGAAVGERLLTEEVISAELINPKIIGHIKTFVVTDLLKEDHSIYDLLTIIMKDEAEGTYRRIKQEIQKGLIDKVSGDETKALIERSVIDYVSQTVPYNVSLESLLPDHLLEEAYGLVHEHRENIAAYLVNLLKQDGVKTKISQIISELIMSKVGALGAMFLNPSDLTLTIIDYAEKTIYEEDVLEALEKAIVKGIMEVTSKNIKEVISLGLYDELIRTFSVKMVEGILGLIKKDTFEKALDQMVDQFFMTKIPLSDHEKKKIEAQVEAAYVSFVKGNIKTFLETFNVSSIVEGEINTFSVMEVETLIFGIVDKELKAITWLGALLGFIMGLFYLIF